MAKKRTSKKPTAKKTKKKSEPKSEAKHKKADASKTKISSKSNVEKELILKSIVAIVAVIAIIAVVFGILRNSNDSGMAARIGDQYITVKELNQEYSYMPQEYQAFITKEAYLENVMIPQKLLSIKAVEISDEEVDELYNDYLWESGLSEAELADILADQGRTIKELKELIRTEIYLEKELAEQIYVSDEEIIEFYEFQSDFFIDEQGNQITLDEMWFDIEHFLRSNKLQEAAALYVEVLMQEFDVEIYYSSNDLPAFEMSADVSSINTFQQTGDDLCEEDGKPLVILFSTTTCPYCTWIKDTFDSTVMGYGDSIAAYHWELNIGNNALSGEVETEVPKKYLDLFRQYNPRGSVPTYVFGCKYIRIGNGYSDLASEAAEFRAVIDTLIA